VAQCLASPSDVTSGPIEEAKPPAADVNLLLGSAEEESPCLPLEHTLDKGAAVSLILLPPRIPVPFLASAADAAPRTVIMMRRRDSSNENNYQNYIENCMKKTMKIK
jgi:hypothetical protein